MAPTPIFVRKTAADEGSEDSDSNDIWDDTLLIKTYEDSLKLAKEEVAKRIAMSTNNKQKSKDNEKVKNNESDENAQEEEEEFQVGSYARATFEDGVDYEAKIQEIDETGKCLIKYIGYNNVQYVNKANLLSSWGRAARRQQKKDAELENASVKSDVNQQIDFDGASMLAGTSGSRTTKQMRPKKTNRIQFPQTNVANYMNVNNHHHPGDAPIMVPPPPPMPPQLGTSAAESESLSAMLMSWYMSGYYTGLYQGQKMAQQSSKSRKQ